MDAEHQKTVNVSDAGFFVNITCKEQSVLRFASAVSAHIQVPAVLCCNDAASLALCFGAFPYAAAHCRLDLMRRTQCSVACFDADGKSDAVVKAESAPCAANEAFDSPQCFTL